MRDLCAARQGPSKITEGRTIEIGRDSEGVVPALSCAGSID